MINCTRSIPDLFETVAVMDVMMNVNESLNQMWYTPFNESLQCTDWIESSYLQGVDVRDEFGNTPLIVACQNGKKRVAKLFLRLSKVILVPVKKYILLLQWAQLKLLCLQV